MTAAQMPAKTAMNKTPTTTSSGTGRDLSPCATRPTRSDPRKLFPMPLDLHRSPNAGPMPASTEWINCIGRIGLSALAPRSTWPPSDGRVRASGMSPRQSPARRRARAKAVACRRHRGRLRLGASRSPAPGELAVANAIVRPDKLPWVRSARCDRPGAATRVILTSPLQ